MSDQKLTYTWGVKSKQLPNPADKMVRVAGIRQVTIFHLNIGRFSSLSRNLTQSNTIQPKVFLKFYDPKSLYFKTG